MKTIKGDLILLAKDGNFDVIVHGCNCMCTMGAGIAQSIKKEFPEAYKADLQTPKADETKLGTCSFAVSNTNYGIITIVNAYTQYNWRGSGVLADYDAIRSCLKWVKTNFGGKRIGLPKIGAGLARGDWNKISNIIEDELAGEDVTFVIFDPDLKA